MNYESIKELARDAGQRVTDLIALAPANDPFYTGTPGDWQNGHWFADLWQRFGYGSGVHIRRVHYQIISQTPPVAMPNGLPYENTERCWDFLNAASKAARYLELVEPGAFVDRRNPEPRIYAGGSHAEPTIEVSDPSWSGTSIPDFPDLPDYHVYSFEGRQRYHLEIWCEKSTMNDVLIPLCQNYGINLVTGVGEMSITAVLQLAERFEAGRPVRVFYVSDFDPAGQSMPVAVARKVEYFQRQKGYEADVRLFPVVLTVDQVRQFRLPRTPIKETEKRAGHFEDRYGAGAVELDALEALYPGQLQRILTTEIRRYHDSGLSRRVDRELQRLQGDLERTRQAIIASYQEDIDELRAEYDELRADFEERFNGYAERVTDLWAVMVRDLEEDRLDLGSYPIPEANDGDEREDALYDSERDYLSQMDAYKEFQGKVHP